MKSDIMCEYLAWFDKKMAGRKVVLCLDNFSAHEKGVREMGGDIGLKNTRIIWLPANTTSKWQPMDQGIIQTWKAYTRRHFIRYLVNQIDTLNLQSNLNEILPQPTILQAIRWGVEAWNFDVKPSTIFNCFIKSGIKYIGPVPPPPIEDHDNCDMNNIRSEVHTSIDILRNANLIGLGLEEPLDIDGFFNPEREAIEDSPDILEVTHSFTRASIQIY